MKQIIKCSGGFSHFEEPIQCSEIGLVILKYELNKNFEIVLPSGKNNFIDVEMEGEYGNYLYKINLTKNTYHLNEFADEIKSHLKFVEGSIRNTITTMDDISNKKQIDFTNCTFIPKPIDYFKQLGHTSKSKISHKTEKLPNMDTFRIFSKNEEVSIYTPVTFKFSQNFINVFDISVVVPNKETVLIKSTFSFDEPLELHCSLINQSQNHNILYPFVLDTEGPYVQPQPIIYVSTKDYLYHDIHLKILDKNGNESNHFKDFTVYIHLK